MLVVLRIRSIMMWRWVNYDVEVGQFCCLVLVKLRVNYDVEVGQL